jgi:uncharacterized protein DUF6978
MPHVHYYHAELDEAERREAASLRLVRQTASRVRRAVRREVELECITTVLGQGRRVADINLTQADADVLLAMEKHKIEDTPYEYPSLGGGVRIPLQSTDKRELFFLDITRSQVVLTKGTYQNRARGVAILARLDFDGAPHRNPDDREVPCPHLHLYREGYGDRWAIPLPAERFSDASDSWLLLLEFIQFVNITVPPDVRRDLFT